MTQRIQPQANDTANPALVFFKRDGLFLIEPDADFITPAERQGEHSNQPRDPLWIGDVGVFEIKAPALHGGKQALDIPYSSVISSQPNDGQVNRSQGA